MELKRSATETGSILNIHQDSLRWNLNEHCQILPPPTLFYCWIRLDYLFFISHLFCVLTLVTFTIITVFSFFVSIFLCNMLTNTFVRQLLYKYVTMKIKFTSATNRSPSLNVGKFHLTYRLVSATSPYLLTGTMILKTNFSGVTIYVDIQLG